MVRGPAQGTNVHGQEERRRMESNRIESNRITTQEGKTNGTTHIVVGSAGSDFCVALGTVAPRTGAAAAVAGTAGLETERPAPA